MLIEKKNSPLLPQKSCSYIHSDGTLKSAITNRNFLVLCSYMVRSQKGIEMLVNLINIAYGAMKLLPYQDEVFSKKVYHL